MRFIYLADFVVLGLSVWPGLIKHQGLGDPLQAVAISFWAALSVLAALGIRYPLRVSVVRFRPWQPSIKELRSASAGCCLISGVP
jgi:hypothetical protein